MAFVVKTVNCVFVCSHFTKQLWRLFGGVPAVTCCEPILHTHPYHPTSHPIWMATAISHESIIIWNMSCLETYNISFILSFVHIQGLFVHLMFASAVDDLIYLGHLEPPGSQRSLGSGLNGLVSNLSLVRLCSWLFGSKVPTKWNQTQGIS